MEVLQKGYDLLRDLEDSGQDTITANATAGMEVALDLLRAMDIVSGG